MALKKKSIPQASKKRTPSPKKKLSPSSQKGPASSKQGTVSSKKSSSKKSPAAPKKGAATRSTSQAQRTRPARASRPRVTTKTLEALNDRLDIMLPEVMFRIAAIEHLLVKNQLCMYDELTNARQFIQEQERT